jgi:hypothetical protein
VRGFVDAFVVFGQAAVTMDSEIMAQSGRTISVVLPAYNEAQRLPATLRAVHRFFEEHLGSADIVVATTVRPTARLT